MTVRVYMKSEGKRGAMVHAEPHSFSIMSRLYSTYSDDAYVISVESD